MLSLDLSTSLAPVINLTEVPTAVAMARASTCERVTITIDHIPEAGEMVLPIRIIEGMGRIADRGTVNKKQASLISALVSLMQESPLLRA